MIYFLAGTDTDCGKTLISSALLYKAQSSTNHRRTLGLKPVASGCELTACGLRNSDALSLMVESSIKLEYQYVNSFAFMPAIAPHIAAVQVGVELSPDTVLEKIQLSLGLAKLCADDFCIIEGAGGWRLPLSFENKQGRFLSEVVQALSLPVILVVGVKLGCLNHAILTQEAMLADGIEIVGWVANIVDGDTACLDENLQSLSAIMQASCLGIVPHLDRVSAETVAQHLDLSPLFIN